MKKKGCFIILAIAVISLCAAFFFYSFFNHKSKEDEHIVLEMWTHEDSNRALLEDRYAKEFMQTHPNVEINITRQSSTKLIELVQTAFAAGEGPTIFNLSINDEYPLITTGRVAPMDYEAAGYKDAEDVKSYYIDGMLDPVSYNGEIYGLPLELTNWCIFINKKVFRDAGLDPETDYPKTWEDIVRLSEKIVIRDGNILVRRGFYFRYPYFLEAMVPMVEQLGGKLISDDGKEAIVGEEAWIKWLTFMQMWGPNGLNLGSPTYKNARSLFNYDNNDIAMAQTGLYQEARMKSDNSEFFNSGEWMVVPYPVFEDAVVDTAACYYGHYYMVNGDCDEKTRKVAWEFISYMLSHGEEYLEEVAIIQPTKALFNSEAFKAKPYSDIFAKDFERGHIVYYGESSSAIQSLLRTAVGSVMLQNESPRSAYLKLKSAVQEIIDEKR